MEPLAFVPQTSGNAGREKSRGLNDRYHVSVELLLSF